MLKKIAIAARPSSIAGYTIFAGLRIANRLQAVEDKRLKHFTDEVKPLVVENAAAEANCSPVYVRRPPLVPQQGSFTPQPNDTLIDTLKVACVKYAHRKAMGVRPVDRVEHTVRNIDGKDKRWETVHLKPTVYYDYQQLWDMIEGFGKGLMELGLKPEALVTLCEETRMEWFVACYGVWYAGAVGCTVYANMNASAMEFALNQIGGSHVFCNASAVPALMAYYTSPERRGTAPIIIYTDRLPEGFSKPEGFSMCSFDEVIAKGKSSSKTKVGPKSRDDLALIMYTSGTTGKPKGVMITHDNILATVTVLDAQLEQLFGERESLTYLAFLPLAHILEFASENTLLHRGLTLGFGSPRTLTNNSALPHGDLQEFRPQFMCGVPRVYDSIRKTVYGKLKNPVVKYVFEAAYRDKLHLMKAGKDTPLYNRLLFTAVRDSLGGRIEALLSGGAPISPKVQEFMQVCVTPQTVQGYGLTETCACGVIQLPGDLKSGTVGAILPGVEIKLRDTADWRHTDKPEPRGEILMRGRVVTKGYFQRPEKTAEAYEEGGWFSTGDVGALTPEGNLRIVGRVESLVKNANGEYIAMEALESIYGLNSLVAPNSVCVLVDPHKDYICAIALTDKNKTMSFAQKHGLSGTWPTILKDKAFMNEVQASFRRNAERNRIKPNEILRKVALIHDEWTADNGCLTAAMKLKRPVILERYDSLIKELFVD